MLTINNNIKAALILLAISSSAVNAEVKCTYTIEQGDNKISEGIASADNDLTVMLNGTKWRYCQFSKVNLIEVDTGIEKIGKKQYLGINTLCATKDGSSVSISTKADISEKWNYDTSYLKLIDVLLKYNGITNESSVAKSSKIFGITSQCVNK